MNSNKNDRSNAYQDTEREGRFSYPEEGYSGGYEASEGEPYHYGGSGFAESHGREYSPGYSTANDFSGQEPARGRLRSPANRREYGGYGQEYYPRRRERSGTGEYPETYRSAMSGYM